MCICLIGDEFDRDYFYKIVIKLFEFDVFVADLTADLKFLGKNNTIMHFNDSNRKI